MRYVHTEFRDMVVHGVARVAASGECAGSGWVGHASSDGRQTTTARTPIMSELHGTDGGSSEARTYG